MREIVTLISRIALSAAMLVYAIGAIAASDMEEVVVTGSYIKGSAEDAASPISVISREDIDIQSAVTIDDITKNLTIASGATTNHNYDTENATISGKANVNLRGLGLNSTLVLFNGKRQVVAAATSQDGSEFVDINTIPLVMLDRVEILKDGGSALYGSDAIAGVVNFIMRDTYEGFQIAGDLTSSDRADANDTTLSALWGTSFNDGKTHIVLAGEYFERDPYGFLDLGTTSATDRVTVRNSTITALVSGPTTPFNPAYFNAADSATAGTPKFTDPLCVTQGYSTGLYDDPANNPNSHCREDTRAYRGAQLAQERSVFMATMKHEFSDNVELYGMVQYNDQDIRRPINGAFGSIDDINGILPGGDPVFGLGSRSASVIAARDAAFGAATVAAQTPGTAIFDSSLAAGLAAGAPGSAAFTAAFGGAATALVGQAGFVAATGALPTPANAPILQANGGPNALSVMGHQVSKVGDFAFHPQNSESNSKTSGASIGLRGGFEAMDREMSFDVSLSYSKNRTYREELSVNRVALELAQNGLGGPNCVPNGVDNYDVNADAQDVFGGGVFGGPVSFLFTNPAPRYVLNMRKNISLALTSTNQGVGDCQFLNPYLTKETSLPNDPALINHIYQVIPFADQENELLTLDMVLTSELFSMAGGKAQGAVGYQRRDGTNLAKSYPQSQPGLQDFLTYGANPTFLNVSDDHYYVGPEAFNDTRVVDALFGEVNLPLNDGLEVQLAVRYEDYGGTIGDSTTPKIGVRWQALESLTVRSSFSQSFRAPNTGVIFSGVGFDGNTANDFLHKDDVRAGILPPSEANAEVRNIIQSGQPSPLVGTEQADSFNVGVIFKPLSVEGLTLGLDYYRFEFKDKVVNQPLSVTLATELANFTAAAAIPTNYINKNSFLACTPDPTDNSCVVNPAAYATVGVQRSPTGDLQVVNFNSINAGGIETSGVDITASYAIDASYGTWNLGLNVNRILEFVPSDIPGFENGILGTGVRDAAGTSGDGSVVRSMPDTRANVTVNFNRSNHSVTGILRYISGYDNLQAQVFNGGANPPKTVFGTSIDQFVTLDLQYNYQWSWGQAREPLAFTLGMVNATDEDPPRRDDFNSGFDSTAVDPRGRRFYMRAMQTF
jgi:outer membrane receptor protein involved in Fe transport